ncbi:hypothetical protein EP331_05405 [bacterium]|nr:MAG: hypothetical protein EP331_05405 [bacterium]
MKFLSVFFALLFVSVLLVSAQPPPLLDGPSQAPIDGGLGLLLAGGGAYALKKLRKQKSR